MKRNLLFNCSFHLVLLISFFYTCDVTLSLSPVVDNKLLSSIQITAAATSQNTTTSNNTKKNQTKPSEKNETKTKDSQSPKKTSNSTNSTSSPALDKKKLQDYAEQTRKMMEIFIRTIEGVKNVINKIKKQDEILKHVNKTVRKSLNITSGLNKKLVINQMRTEIKLKKINRHLMMQLESQIKSTIGILEQEIIKQLVKLSFLNIKIAHLKMRLPKFDSVCSHYMSCSKCTKNKECGWCSMSQTCMEGNKNGPTNGSCMFFDYGVCSGKKDCDEYADCKSCVRDNACGWCNRPGNPSCLNVEDVNKDTCREDIFVQRTRSLNICPHRTLDTYKAKLLRQLEEERYDIAVREVNASQTIDPQERKKITRELKIFQDKKAEEEGLLKLLRDSLNNTETSLNQIRQDDYVFHHYYSDRDINSKILHKVIMKMYSEIKEFVIDYRIYKLEQRMKKQKKKKKKQTVIKVLEDGTIMENNKVISSDKRLQNLKKQSKFDFGKLKHKKAKAKQKTNITKVSTKTVTMVKNTTIVTVTKVTKKPLEINELIKEYKNKRKIKKEIKKLNKKIDRNIVKLSTKKSYKEDVNNPVYQIIKKHIDKVLKPKKTPMKVKVQEKKKKSAKKPDNSTISVKICNDTELNVTRVNVTKTVFPKKANNQTKPLTKLPRKKLADEGSAKLDEKDMEDFRNEEGYENLKSFENKEGNESDLGSFIAFSEKLVEDGESVHVH